jgi:hypothetical protein
MWAPLGNEGLLGGPGDPIIWVLAVLPVLVVCSVMNFVWLMLVLLHMRRTRDWYSVAILLLVVILWSGAIGYDHSRQYKGTQMLPDHSYSPR